MHGDGAAHIAGPRIAPGKQPIIELPKGSPLGGSETFAKLRDQLRFGLVQLASESPPDFAVRNLPRFGEGLFSPDLGHRGCEVSIIDQALREVCATVSRDDAGPELVILRDAVALIVSAEFIPNDVGAKHDRSVHERIEKRRSPGDSFMGDRRIEQTDKLVLFVDDAAIGAEENNLGTLLR